MYMHTSTHIYTTHVRIPTLPHPHPHPHLTLDHYGFRTWSAVRAAALPPPRCSFRRDTKTHQISTMSTLVGQSTRLGYDKVGQSVCT